MNKLIDYYGNQNKCANSLGISPMTVSKWIRGDTKPSIKNCKMIETKTKGEITIKDLRPDIFK